MKQPQYPSQSPVIKTVQPPSPAQSVQQPHFPQCPTVQTPQHNQPQHFQHPASKAPEPPKPAPEVADPSLLLQKQDLPIQQFNSPINLYSDQTASEEFQRQTKKLQPR